MGGSRIAWAGSAVAPWGIALGLLVSITARADQDPSVYGSTFERNGRIERASAADAALASTTFGAPGARQAPLGAEPDEVLGRYLLLAAGGWSFHPGVNSAEGGKLQYPAVKRPSTSRVSPDWRTSSHRGSFAPCAD